MGPAGAAGRPRAARFAAAALLVLLLAAGLVLGVALCRGRPPDAVRLGLILLWWVLTAVGSVLALRVVSPAGLLTVEGALRDRVMLGPLALAVLAGLDLALLGDAVANGDAAFYNTQIDSGELGGQAIHLGYVLLGRFWVWLVPGPTDLAMNCLSAVLGLLGAACLFTLVRGATRNAGIACLATLGVGTSALYVHSSVYAEVYLPGTALCLLALACRARGRAFTAGLVYGGALAIAVLNLAFLPLFFLPLGKGGRWGRLALGAGLVGLALFLPEARLWLHGDRGLLTGAGKDFDPALVGHGWMSSAKILGGSLPVLLPLCTAALVGLALRPGWLRARWVLPGLATLVLHGATAGKFDEWGFDVPILPLLVIPGVAFLHRMTEPGGAPPRRAGRWLAVAVLAVIANGLCSGSLWVPGFLREPRTIRADFHSLAQQLPDDVVVAGDWSLAGQFARATGKPFWIPPPVREWEPEKCYLILDRETRRRFLDQGLAADRLVEYRVGPAEVWVFRPGRRGT
jgi:hypothetical protein